MGNDGGSIPGRSDLVRVRDASSRQKRAHELDRDDPGHGWRYCRLSRAPLRRPLASDAYGNLYNKEAVIRHLLDNAKDSTTANTAENTAAPPGADGEAKDVVRIGSMKDVVELHVGAAAGRERGGEKFLCEITRRDMDGSARFCYAVPCGHVVAREALDLGRQKPKARDASTSTEATTAQCLVCDAEYDIEVGLVEILPRTPELRARAEQRLATLQRRGLSHSLKPTGGRKKDREKKKRKAGPIETLHTATTIEIDPMQAPRSKKIAT